jgi:conjugative relaxase-like TrwC/TraI family protein
MLFVNHAMNPQSAKDYFTAHLSRSDYYMRDEQEVAGQWHGRGAELLGLSGTVDKDSYFRLCENINPATGEQLTPRLKTDRRVLYDFTFDAPKSVTLAYELGGDERIENVFREAVKETMAEMEDAMQARVRKDRAQEDRKTANMIWGEFIHRTTRPVDGSPDPQLHCHAVAFNATFDPVEERWKAGEFSNLVRDKGYYQAAFHSRFAQKLASLGYGIERDGNSFRLAGIDRKTVETFSRRTAIIKDEAQRLGRDTPEGRRDLGRRTREVKPDEQMTMTELRELWNERLDDGERQAIFKARFGQENTSPGAAAAMDYALTHSFERSSAVTEKELLKTALIHSVGSAGVSDIQQELSRPNILLADKGRITYATTKEVWLEEISLRDFVREGRGKHCKLGGYQPHALDPELSAEQREAAELILGSRDTVTALKGGAGTGKTRMLLSTTAAIKTTGKEVHPFAPSADAAAVLQKEGFGEAATVERLLIDSEMQSKIRGQVLLVDEAGLLSVKDMKRLFDVAKQQNARLILVGDSAQHHGVTRGDALRLLEKDTGMKTAVLKDIRRQTNDDYRAAVKAISEGDAPGAEGSTRLEEGIKRLDDMGAIVEVSGEDRYRQIAADYAGVIGTRKHGGGYKTALVISPTHKEGEKVSAAIRDELKAEGRIGDDERPFLSLRPLNLTEAERGDKRAYFGSEVVQFMQNAKGFKRGERVQVTGSDSEGVHITRADGSADMLPLNEAKKFAIFGKDKVALAAGDKLRVTMNGLLEREARRGAWGRKAKDRINNGSIYEVEGFTKGGDIQLTNGFVIPKNYGGITHGYVVTSHASQGKTVDVSLVALGQESFSAANREQFYVSVSRGKEAVRLYTDDKAAMMDAVQDSAARLSATELMQSQPPKPKRNSSFMQRLIRTGFVQRAYTAVRERMAAYAWAVNHPHHSHGEGMSLEH